RKRARADSSGCNAIRELLENLCDDAVDDGLEVLPVFLAYPPHDRAFPDELVAAGVDDVDGQGAFGVLRDHGVVVAPDAVVTAPVAVVTEARRHRLRARDLFLRVDEEVDQQVGLVRSAV